jgi:hypothetical protein
MEVGVPEIISEDRIRRHTFTMYVSQCRMTCCRLTYQYTDANEDWKDHGANSPGPRPNELDTLKSIIKSRMIEHFRVELLCGLTIGDVEANIEDVLEKAIDDWENGTAIADANLATLNLAQNATIDDQKMDDVPPVHNIVLGTPPPSTPGSSCVNMDDTKVWPTIEPSVYFRGANTKQPN